MLLQLLVGTVVPMASSGIRWHPLGMVVMARSLCGSTSLLCRIVMLSSGIKCGMHSGSGLTTGLVTTSGGAAVFTLRGAAGLVVTAGIGGTLIDGAVVGRIGSGGKPDLVVPWRITINCWSALL